MDTTKTLLERLRTKYDGCSDYRLAQILGIVKTAVSRYTKHGGGMANDVGVRLAAELGLDPAYVVACLALEREQSEAVKPIWRDLITRAQASGQIARAPSTRRRVSKVAAVLLTTGIAALASLTPSPARASQDAASVYYGKRRRHLPNPCDPARFTRRHRPRRRRASPMPASFPIVPIVAT